MSHTHPTTATLAEPLTLPGGAVLKNRLAKSAMSEALASRDAAPNRRHVALYRTWARGGAGLVISGNVMVDRTALGEPGNVAIEDERHLHVLREWAQAGTEGGAHLWMQINHPGKQSPRSVNSAPVAPSAVPIGGDMSRLFVPPCELTRDEIRDLVRRFVTTARIAKEAGFTGVQIHGAHGYLVNQFLSPRDNHRTDEYGGDLAARMRFLVEIYEGMRAELGGDFPIGLKLNSADFVEGGFTQEESIEVARRMAGLGLDLLEISGGTYASPVMQTGGSAVGAYFSDYARRLRDEVDIPVLLTGGFRTAEAMADALSDNVTDVIGLARPLVVEPDLPARLLTGGAEPVRLPRLSTRVPALDKAMGSALALTWYELQMRRIADGKRASDSQSAWPAIGFALRQHGPGALRPRRAARARG